MTKSVETEIENLKIYRENMTNDIQELKENVKDIKTFLMGSETEDPKVVTRKEFDEFRRSQVTQKILVGIITAVMTAIITFEVMKVTK